MRGAGVHRVLLGLGFQEAGAAEGEREWGVEGGFEDGQPIVVTCWRDRLRGHRVHVAPANAAEWLRSVMRVAGEDDGAIIAEPPPASGGRDRARLIALAAGVAAASLFAWVLIG